MSTADGPKRIADLVGKAAFVIGADGQPHFVSKIFPTGTKPVYRLQTKAGYEVTLTADHKVWTENRGDVAASELRMGDTLALGGSGFGPEDIERGIALGVGIAIGDGCVTNSTTPGLILTMAAEEAGVLEDVADSINLEKSVARDGRGRRASTVTMPAKAIGVPCVRWKQGDCRALFTIRRLERRQLCEAFYRCNIFAKRFFDCRCASRPVYRGRNRRQLRREVSVCFPGLIIADTPQTDAAHPSLFRDQIEALLNRRTSLVSNCPDGKGGHSEYPVTQMHSLRISRSSRLAFEKHIGFHRASAKSRALGALNASVHCYADKMHDDFSSLQLIGDEPVFDLTEQDTNHFIGNGLRVHNCSEYVFIDDTACNLSSINLVKFLKSDDNFDAPRFAEAARFWTTTLEISVTMGQMPSKAIAEKNHGYRTLGLGYANLGTLLMRIGLPYDSEEGFGWCAAINALMTGTAYRTSAEMARQLGPFARFEANREPMVRVIRNHRRAAYAAERVSTKGCRLRQSRMHRRFSRKRRGR